MNEAMNTASISNDDTAENSAPTQNPEIGSVMKFYFLLHSIQLETNVVEYNIQESYIYIYIC